MSAVPAPRSEETPEGIALDVLVAGLSARDVTLHDLDRLAAVQQLVLDAPEVEELVADLLQEAATRLHADTALLNVVLDEIHLVVGAHGLSGWIDEARAFPADWSFCATTVRRGAVHLVPDAAADPEHADSPIVTVDGVRTYAGAPLLTPEGLALGALCVLGAQPRAWEGEDAEVLRELAARVVERLSRAREARSASAG